MVVHGAWGGEGHERDNDEYYRHVSLLDDGIRAYLK